MAGELVLITGISGHVGFQTLSVALATGYRVRGIDNLLKVGAFDTVVKDVTYIVHIASPLARMAEDPDKEIIESAVNGTLNILSGAQKSITVKRIVLTFSVAILIANRQRFNQVLTERDVVPRPSPPYGKFPESYLNGKTLAYYATSDWVETNKPTFDIIHILPSFIIGPNELNTTVKEMVSGSNSLILRPLLGFRNTENPIPYTTVHIEDAVTAHIKALDPTVKGGQSFLLSAPLQKGKWDDMFEIVQKSFPLIKRKCILPLNGTQATLNILLDSSKAEKELGITFKLYERQLKDLVGQYLDLAASR
ncbi:hypothetical protein B7463_g1642, partial [Scytalidium lignicola]